MKRILHSWLWLAIVPLIFASCDDDESEVTASSQTIAILTSSDQVVEGETAPFSVIFLGTPDEQTSDITVNYEITGTTDGTLTGSTVIPSGQQSVEFNISIPEDNVLEDESTDILFSLTSASGGFAINENFPQNRKELILLEDTKNISVTNDTISIAENFSSMGDILTVPINITSALDSEVSLSYTLSGTAVEGVDYELVSDNPLVMASGTTEASIGLRILDDIVAEVPAKTIYLQVDGISVSDMADEETTLLAENENRVVAYNIMDDSKVFGYDIAPTDTIVMTATGNTSTSISHTGTLLNAASLTFTDNLPAGVTLDATSMQLDFSASEVSRNLEFNVDASAFTGTDVFGTFVISAIDGSGDEEAVISAANNTIVIKIVNE